MDFYAEEYSHKVVNQLPLVTLEESEKYNLSKLEIEDKWSSHPSIKDRVLAIEKENIPSVNVNNNWQKHYLSILIIMLKLLQINYTALTEWTRKQKRLMPKAFSSYFKKNIKTTVFLKCSMVTILTIIR